MTGLYLFAAAAGIPLALWFALSGDGDGEGGGSDSIAGVFLRRIPLSTIAFVLATFGLCGLVLTAVGTGGGATLVAAAIAGLMAGTVNHALYAYLRQSESTTEVGDQQLIGSIGSVVVPVTAEHRGRISVTVGDQRIHLSAIALPDALSELEPGAAVLVVDVRNGIARVSPLDPELR